jgi:probable HAF family extracellular repeat protein
MKLSFNELGRTGLFVAVATAALLVPMRLLRHDDMQATKPVSLSVQNVVLDKDWNTMGIAINDNNEVVGTAFDGKNAVRAFVVRGKKAQLLPLPKGMPMSVATGINAEGVVVGSVGGDSTVRGVIWRGEQAGVLTSGSQDTFAVTLSKSGVAAGAAFEGPPPAMKALQVLDVQHPFSLEPLRVDFAGMAWSKPGAGKSLGEFLPQAGNASGGLTGLAVVKDKLVPALFKSGKPALLPAPDGSEMAVPLAINDKDIVVGAAILDQKVRPVGWSKGRSGFLPVPGDRQGVALGISPTRIVVGAIETETGEAHAAVWKDGKVLDLNDAIDKDSGWVLAQARGVNAKGFIVGTGTKGNKIAAFVIGPLK